MKAAHLFAASRPMSPDPAGAIDVVRSEDVELL
jgi:hypothetical protein